MRNRDEMIDIACEVMRETDKAVLVSETGEKDDGVWLPKSQIEINDDGTISLPEWLAMDKGLI